MPKVKITNYIHRRELTLEERIGIIKKYQQAIRIADIAQIFHCNPQQIRRTIRRKDDYLHLWMSDGEGMKTVRRLRTPELIATGRILYEWVIRARYLMNITDDVLKKTGHAVAKHIGYEDFKSNNRWLDRFKTKYKLHKIKLTGLNKGAVSRKNQKSLDIADIIDCIKREDPQSLPDCEKGFDGELTLPVDDDELPDVGENIAQNARDNRRATLPDDQGIEVIDVILDSDEEDNENDLTIARPIRTYNEALSELEQIAQFILFKGNVQGVTIVNQLETLLQDEIARGKG